MTTVELTVNIIAATDLAVLCEVEDAEVWIPRSLIEDGDTLVVDMGVDIEVQQWFAEREGIW